MQKIIEQLEAALAELGKEPSSWNIAASKTAIKAIIDFLKAEIAVRAKKSIELTQVKAAETVKP